MSAFEIVQAVPDNAKEIGVLRANNWKEQYATLDGVTQEWMDKEVERIAGDEGSQQRARWIERATKEGADNYWLVARSIGDRALIGFLEARKYDGSQELRSLHIAADHRGLRVGQALMDVATTEWFDPTVETFLDVAKVNEAGQRFYARSPNDYTLTGHEFSYGPVAMLQMVRKPQGKE